MGKNSERWGSPARFSLIMLIGLVAMAGCSTTRIEQTWQAPAFKRGDLNQVLVVAIATDIGNRIEFENSFTRELRQKGVDAIASYEVLGSQLPSQEGVLAYLAQHRIPHLVVAEYAAATVSQVAGLDPSSIPDTGPVGSTYGGFWDRQDYLDSFGEGGYFDYTERLVLTTSIYDVGSQNLVWRGRSNSFEVTTIAVVADAVARAIWSSIDT